MTVVNFATGEIISEAQVRASIKRVIDHAESIWDEWAWQVENQTWTVLGYSSWDEMRRAEYGALTSVSAPRAERPELVSRFRGAGLTQRQTAETLGVSQQTVSNYDKPRQVHPLRESTNSGTSTDDIVDAELVDEDEPASNARIRSVRKMPRPAAEKTLNIIGLYAGKAARAAADLTPEQIRRIRPEADAWVVGLRQNVEALQRLIDSLDN